MRKTGPVEEGHVVKEFKIGNTTVRICDDYCRDKTKEDVDAILKRIAERAQRALTAQALRGELDESLYTWQK